MVQLVANVESDHQRLRSDGVLARLEGLQKITHPVFHRVTIAALVVIMAACGSDVPTDGQHKTDQDTDWNNPKDGAGTKDTVSDISDSGLGDAAKSVDSIEKPDAGSPVTEDVQKAGDSKEPTPDQSTAGNDVSSEDAPGPTDTSGTKEVEQTPDVDQPIPEVDSPDTKDAGPPECTCDDKNPCTVDNCDDNGKCVFTPVPLPCVDADPCFVGDVCENGECKNGTVAVTCDDKNSCTKDICDTAQGGCVHTTDNSATDCDDGQLCTHLDTCTNGICTGAPKQCEDDSTCTDDSCDPATGDCQFKLTIDCNDDNACTEDSCDAKTGCKSTNLPNKTACKDSDPCSLNDECIDGECAPGSKPLLCNDDNVCTQDSCKPNVGCLFVPVEDGLPCDDKDPNTPNDTCKNGSCNGGTSDCTSNLDLQSPTMKVTELELDSGLGLDINGDGLPDNALKSLGAIISTFISPAVKNGDMILLAHANGFNTSSPFPIHLFEAELDSSNKGCNVQTQSCEYLISPTGFDEICDPVSTIPENTSDAISIVSTKSSTISLPLTFETTAIVLPLHLSKLNANVTLVGNDKIKKFEGLLGGAVPKKKLTEAISKVPNLQPFAFVIETVINNDIDTDLDGIKDAVSLALKIKGIDGQISGVVKKP